MIERLKWHSVEEVKQEFSKLTGDNLGLFSPLVTEPLPPTDDEIVDKINEIIEHINSIEGEENETNK